MKSHILRLAMLLGSSIATTGASTLSFTGNLEHTNSMQVTDWHFFEVTQPTTLRIESVISAGNFRESWLVLGAFVGGAELLGVQLVLGDCGEVICFNQTQAMKVGQWAIGFAPVTTARNPAVITDATFPSFMSLYGRGGYTLTLNSSASDIRWLEHREGNLDGTFTTTAVPEPAATLLLATGILILRRRRVTMPKEEKGAAGQPLGLPTLLP